MVAIRYVWHDCFVVETSGCSMVFDYWIDGAPGSAMPRAVSALDRKKPLYVFVSHSHKDHFNPAIFGWASEFDDIRYIVSKDVAKRIRHVVSPTSIYNGPKVAADKVTVLRPGEKYEDALIAVAAFASTDIGNSYAVVADGKSFFHAGDLNAWIWKDESTEQEVRKAIGDFKAVLRDIRESGFDGFDYAFFPVDSRIGTDWFEGARIFVREFAAGHFFPMHFALGDEAERRQRQEDAVKFPLYMHPSRGEYIALTAPSQLFVAP